MCARLAGRRSTSDRVVRLLKEEVGKTSQAATARATGLPLRSVQNYLKGIGEPTQATLEKLAAYFGVRVRYLRGEPKEPLDRLLEGLREGEITPEVWNKKFAEELGKTGDYWGDLIAGKAVLDADTIEYVCGLFDFKIDPYWVETGNRPSELGQQGFVGTIDPGGWTLRDGPMPVINLPLPLHIPRAFCAKCGGELQSDGQVSSHRTLRFWPCATCCKG